MAFVVDILFSIALSLLKSFVAMNLWIWFMVPAGAPPLSFKTVVGAVLIFEVMTWAKASGERKKSDKEE